MSYIKTTFLGSEYTIPADILLYIDLLDFTSSIKSRLTNTFVRKLKGEIQKGRAYVSDQDLAPELEQQVGLFIAKLTECDIYDRTVSDYLRQNEGYKLISKINATAYEDSQREYDRQMADWREGHESAIQKKDASVTGLGFSIWSSSFINHAIYAAMEASKVNEQEKAAAREYEKEMAELNARLKSKKATHVKWYTETIYIPKMEAAITVFSYELLDTFISDLIKYEKLNKEVLNYTHIDRSNDLLKNLELSQNKPAVLLKAFEACPYNIAVYMQAMKHDLLDYATFQTAKMFGHGNTIISFLEKNLGGSVKSEKKRLNFKNAELLSLYSGRPLREITAYMADFVVDGYAQIIAALSNTTPCYNIMNKVDEDDILAGNNISKEKAKWLVDPLAPVVLWDKLTGEYGHDDLFDRLMALLPGEAGIESKKEYDFFLKKKLFAVLETIRQERVAEILKSRKAEEQRRAAEAEKARRTAKRNKTIKIICCIIAVVLAAAAFISKMITKANNEKAYQEMAGEFCVYRIINDDGEEKDDFNWWLSVGEDGTIKISSWSYVIDNCEVNNYSGTLQNKADFRNFADYRIEDYCVDISEYEKALYCYKFHIDDTLNESNGYIVCWQYHNGKIVDVFYNDYRYSFVEASDDYSFNKWESEIISDELSKNVEKLVDNIDVSEEDEIENIERLIDNGNYETAVEAIVACKLSDAQKNAYYDSLVEKIDFKSFEVNGLVINIPEHWHIEDYSDPYIRSAECPEEDSLFQWYVKYVGTVEQVVQEGDDYWTRDADYSSRTVAGCEEAYVRCELSQKTNDKVYSVIEYYVVCEGFVFEIQYFAYEQRFFEPEMQMLWERVEFSNYAENRAGVQEQKYLEAVALFNNGKYEEALSVFETIVAYKDSEDKITECITAIVVPQINEGDYAAAYDVLIKLNNYPDAVNMLKNFKWAPTKSTYISTKSSESDSYHAYTYDDNSVLIKEIINDSTVVEYSYDAHGNMVLKKYTYPDGDTSQYEYKYNAENRLMQERYTYPDGNVDVVNYTYDADGRIAEAEDIHWGSFNQKLTYSYNTAGKLIKKDTIDHFDSVGCYEYEYDEYGNLTKEIHTTDIGESYSVVYTTEYSYSKDGYLVSIYEYKDGEETGYEVFDEFIVFYSPEGFSD